MEPQNFDDLIKFLKGYDEPPVEYMESDIFSAFPSHPYNTYNIQNSSNVFDAWPLNQPSGTVEPSVPYPLATSQPATSGGQSHEWTWTGGLLDRTILPTSNDVDLGWPPFQDTSTSSIYNKFTSYLGPETRTQPPAYTPTQPSQAGPGPFRKERIRAGPAYHRLLLTDQERVDAEFCRSRHPQRAEIPSYLHAINENKAAPSHVKRQVATSKTNNATRKMSSKGPVQPRKKSNSGRQMDLLSREEVKVQHSQARRKPSNTVNPRFINLDSTRYRRATEDS